ncbi:hypothetical protein RRG08_027683 [Elysia crispata]|uniref:Uncharacterized protein n=1 Tax=Elysia crispata TaxID=231223 RepID=A0AAE1CIP8_9GAST|nr:hypothetical protein RRG08_027683 [Elysia crispata]
MVKHSETKLRAIANVEKTLARESMTAGLPELPLDLSVRRAADQPCGGEDCAARKIKGTSPKHPIQSHNMNARHHTAPSRVHAIAYRAP